MHITKPSWTHSSKSVCLSASVGLDTEHSPQCADFRQQHPPYPIASNPRVSLGWVIEESWTADRTSETLTLSPNSAVIRIGRGQDCTLRFPEGQSGAPQLPYQASEAFFIKLSLTVRPLSEVRHTRYFCRVAA